MHYLSFKYPLLLLLVWKKKKNLLLSLCLWFSPRHIGRFLYYHYLVSWYIKSEPLKIYDFQPLVWANLVTDIFHHFLRSCRNGIRRKHYAYSSWGYGFESCLSRWYYICHGLVFFFRLIYVRLSFCVRLLFFSFSFIHSFRPSGLGLYVRLTK